MPNPDRPVSPEAAPPRATTPEHVCGLMGYNPMLGDSPCPACTAATPEPRHEWFKLACAGCGQSIIGQPDENQRRAYWVCTNLYCPKAGQRQRVEWLKDAPPPRVTLAASSPSGAGTPEPNMVEQVSAAVHDAWMEQQRREGNTSRISKVGEEMMVPYDQLSESCKEYDRVTVRAVLGALPSLGYEVRLRAPTGAGTPLCEWCHGHPDFNGPHGNGACAQLRAPSGAGTDIGALNQAIVELDEAIACGPTGLGADAKREAVIHRLATLTARATEAEREIAKVREWNDRLARENIITAARATMRGKVDEAMARFLMENPKPTGSKADREDYAVMVSNASLRCLRRCAREWARENAIASRARPNDDGTWELICTSHTRLASRRAARPLGEPQP